MHQIYQIYQIRETISKFNISSTNSILALN